MGDSPPPSKLTLLLAGFDRSALRQTDTTVTTVDGRQIVEGKDKRGRLVVKSVITGEQGYVGDVWQDLQVGEVLPGLIMGSQDVAHSDEILKTYKVTHILNCATLVENLYPYKYKYLTIELRDTPQQLIRQHFTEALDFIDEGRKAGCVLVHCNAGVSRSATFVIAYLMQHEGMSFEEAFRYLRTKREKTCPNPGFVSQLKRYEEVLKQQRSQKEKGETKKKKNKL
ncbi:dual specificity protein phosphatase 19-like [Gigantopelta aegis]|uniref:dual specificity protein phosphatase 19-like n=1 Tax=Gigantopelta aegis TaxID=1735272 RepID=UPI001B8884DD|nr:dual specificity protein phosphatase 19-like [Gigantopelta aegis]